MRQDFEKIDYLVGDQDILKSIGQVPSLQIFDKTVVSFLSRLSEVLLHDTQAKKFGDVEALAFWIRRASIERYANQYQSASRIGWGTAFHITPSNIPVQFAVSLIYALTAGNASVVRLSNKNFEQTDIICKALNDVLHDGFENLIPYICVIRYDHNDEITSAITQLSDIRMIWGGDQTISSIRNIQMPPRSLDLGFADRFSIAVIDSDYYLGHDPKYVARDFYLDTYYTDQNACSSTRIVLWTGTSIEKAKEQFWNRLHKEVDDHYQLNDISGSEKLLKTAECAENHPGIRENRIDNSLVRVEIPKIYDDIMDYKGNSGYFFECNLNSFDELTKIITKECQTITYYGDGLYDAIKDVVVCNGLKGGDRIVPLGHSMDLSFVWDGMDMPYALSRIVSNR